MRTVLDKVKKGHDKSSEGTEQYLTGLYNDIKKDLDEVVKNKNEDVDAKKLEAFLQAIKKYQLQGSLVGGDNPFTEFWNIEAMNGLIEELNKYSDGKLLGGNDFNRRGGAALETGLARVVKSFSALLKGDKKAYTNTTSQIGRQKTQIPNLEKTAEEAERKIFYEAYNLTRKVIEDGATDKNGKKIPYMNFIPKVQAKVDNVGLNGTISLSTEVNIQNEIARLLSQATFTAKNYYSNYDITFGKTNPFRVYMTYSDDLNRWFRLYNCFKIHNVEAAFMPFWNIRVIYETSGYKMNYIKAASSRLYGVDITRAKYLVFNSADSIRVVPTYKLINNISVDDKSKPTNWYEALYKPITLSQEKI